MLSKDTQRCLKGDRVMIDLSSLSMLHRQRRGRMPSVKTMNAVLNSINEAVSYMSYLKGFCSDIYSIYVPILVVAH